MRKMLSTKTSLVLTLLCLLLGLTGCQRASRPGQARQVIFLLLDAARPDRFSSYGYGKPTTPNMDRLVDQGVIFFNHFSQATHTRAALPPLLYSRYYALPIFPHSHSVALTKPEFLFHRSDDASLTLPQVLSHAGFLTAAISAHPWLKKNTRFAAEFDELHDLTTSLPPNQPYPPAQHVIDHAIDWLQDNTGTDYFLYLHLMDTHFPHALGRDAREFFGSTPLPRGRFDASGRPRDLHSPLSDLERKYLDALYDGSLRYTDRQIGRLLDFLEDRERLHETLVVITADHGEHLLEQAGRFGHGGPWFDRVGRVPLLLSYPRKVEPRRIATLTESVDILPTILGLLDIDLPIGKHTDGIDVLTEFHTAQGGTRYVVIPGGIRGSQYKVLFDTADDTLLSEQEPPLSSLSGQLFDLLADPEEVHNVWSVEPAVVQSLLQAYRVKMRPLYQRFNRAVTHAQPESAFAITTNHFHATPDIVPLSTDLPADQAFRRCSQHEPQSGWVRFKDYKHFFLLAPPNAGPVSIEFPVPNGSYLLSAAVIGEGQLTLNGTDQPIKFRGPPQYANQLPESREISIGQVEVEDELFHATLRPSTGEGCFLIRYFGFEPVRSGEQVGHIDEARRKQLRSLGYLR